LPLAREAVLNATDIAAHVASAGWARIGPDPAILNWAKTALPLARRAVETSRKAWRCGGTWFAGVDALPNGPRGEVGGTPLPLDLLSLLPGPTVDWHPAQLSTLRPGYPRPWEGESAAAFGYRLNRDAAHVDGLLPIGPERRRMLREPHAFILGLPLTEADPDASPLVVWEGSHEIVRDALRAVLAPHPVSDWPGIDVTDVYHAARRKVFDACPRVTVAARPGEALLLHRLVLHGMARWGEGAVADPVGRMNAYFRPEFTDWADWLAAP
jgi:hypothetical protein